MSESAFQPNTQGLQQLATELRGASERALNDVFRALRRWGQEYKRRVQRVVPVRYGTLRQSFQVIEQRDAAGMSVTVGTSLKSDDGKPYPVYLEFGTDHIAGGRVKQWQPSDAPIMEWPAKMEDIQSLRITGYERRDEKGRYRANGNLVAMTAAGMVGSKRHERAVNIAQRAFTAGQGEQMPFMRPVGYDIAPRVIEDCRVAVKDGFAAVMAGRRL